MRRGVFWTVVALTLALYGTMVFWTLAEIARDAGAPAFDMRPTGYSAEEARTFLAALSNEARALYQGPQRWLDAVYPAMLALTLIWSSHWAADGGRVWLFRAVVLFALLNMLADYGENISVAALLATPVDALSDGMIARAAGFTRAKALFGTVAMTLWLILLALRARRNLTRARG